MEQEIKTLNLLSGMFDEATTAKALNLQPTSLRNIRLRGEGPAYSRLGHKIYYAEADVREWMAKKRVQPKTVRADLSK